MHQRGREQKVSLVPCRRLHHRPRDFSFPLLTQARVPPVRYYLCFCPINQCSHTAMNYPVSPPRAQTASVASRKSTSPPRSEPLDVPPLPRPPLSTSTSSPYLHPSHAQTNPSLVHLHVHQSPPPPPPPPSPSRTGTFPFTGGRTQKLPAHARPAFSSRPSLPSLDTLARMNIVLTKKVCSSNYFRSVYKT